MIWLYHCRGGRNISGYSGMHVQRRPKMVTSNLTLGSGRPSAMLCRLCQNTCGVCAVPSCPTFSPAQADPYIFPTTSAKAPSIAQDRSGMQQNVCYTAACAISKSWCCLSAAPSEQRCCEPAMTGRPLEDEGSGQANSQVWPQT